MQNPEQHMAQSLDSIKRDMRRFTDMFATALDYFASVAKTLDEITKQPDEQALERPDYLQEEHERLANDCTDRIMASLKQTCYTADLNAMATMNSSDLRKVIYEEVIK